MWKTLPKQRGNREVQEKRSAYIEHRRSLQEEEFLSAERLFCTQLFCAVSPPLLWSGHLAWAEEGEFWIAWMSFKFCLTNWCMFWQSDNSEVRHGASSPFPWSGAFPFQLAEHGSHKNGKSNSPCRTAEDWFFVFLTSASFAPLHFHFQEVDAVVVIPWDTCCNLGIDRLSWGKERAPGCLLFFFLFQIAC